MITKPGLLKLTTILVSRDIYNKTTKIYYKITVSKILFNRVSIEGVLR